MQGFIINAVVDVLDGPGGVASISQDLYAYSYHHFFGVNVGDGWFLRGDVGIVKYQLKLDTTLISYNETSKAGFGVLGGGGYGFAIGTETRLLLGAYWSHRKAEDLKASDLNFTVGFLF